MATPLLEPLRHRVMVATFRPGRLPATVAELRDLHRAWARHHETMAMDNRRSAHTEAEHRRLFAYHVNVVLLLNDALGETGS